ncbi:hypothetical protein Zmor_010076 [Zophobas morio]|uniref:Uncharacterized protein n=1 Tax=Zophobas morio TaxID=2755281 RepID=A0AA38IQW2_9CUCU|nr:hypothetical protein Zmor_010076 [Zophobas morio]
MFTGVRGRHCRPPPNGPILAATKPFVRGAFLQIGCARTRDCANSDNGIAPIIFNSYSVLMYCIILPGADCSNPRSLISFPSPPALSLPDPAANYRELLNSDPALIAV